MLFTSYAFIGFLLILFVLYYVLPGKAKIVLLLIASYFFYLSAGPWGGIYIGVTTVTVYVFSLFIGKTLDSSKNLLSSPEGKALSKEEKKAKKDSAKKKATLFMAFCIIINIGILATVKTLGTMRADILVPLGISFYTLQSLSYLIDVKRGTEKAEKNILKVALFISFFPLTVQGPISRFSELKDTLFVPHRFEWKNVSYGLTRILFGYFKKLVIADRLFKGVSTIIADTGTYSGGYAFLLLILYTAELYADFTGGIDIAIGVAEVMGIKVPENFNCPYFSTSLKEYWRRWHITMCNWFKNYVFYPVSISKWMGKVKKFSGSHFGAYVGKRIPVYIASFIVWFLTGIWHGIGWNFITWGLLNFAILMISEELEPLYDRFHNKFSFSNTFGYKVFMMIRTFILICFLNLFDCFSNVGQTFSVMGSVFVGGKYGEVFSGGIFEIGLSRADFIIAGIGLFVVFLVSVFKQKAPVRDRISALPMWCRCVLIGGLFVAIIVFGTYGIGYDASQFIYNRF